MSAIKDLSWSVAIVLLALLTTPRLAVAQGGSLMSTSGAGIRQIELERTGREPTAGTRGQDHLGYHVNVLDDQGRVFTVNYLTAKSWPAVDGCHFVDPPVVVRVDDGRNDTKSLIHMDHRTSRVRVLAKSLGTHVALPFHSDSPQVPRLTTDGVISTLTEKRKWLYASDVGAGIDSALIQDTDHNMTYVHDARLHFLLWAGPLDHRKRAVRVRFHDQARWLPWGRRDVITMVSAVNSPNSAWVLRRLEGRPVLQQIKHNELQYAGGIYSDPTYWLKHSIDLGLGAGVQHGAHFQPRQLVVMPEQFREDSARIYMIGTDGKSDRHVMSHSAAGLMRIASPEPMDRLLQWKHSLLGESASGKVWLRPFTSNIEAARWIRVDGLNHVRFITLDEHENLIGVTGDGVVLVPARDTLRILNKAELDAKVEQPTQ